MEDLYDVVQVGYGPCGQMHATRLGCHGHRIAIFERFPNLYALPRAGHIDHEIMRMFQSVGCAGDIIRDAFPMTKYVWRNDEGETLITFDWDAKGISGWQSDYLFYQPYVEDALNAAARAGANVEVHHGWEAIDLLQHPTHIELTVRRTGRNGESDPTGERRTVKARYLVGADGANSFVRKAVGIEYEDFGFREDWLVLDFEPKREIRLEFDNGQLCDPKRPMCLFQLGQTHRRFEFMVMPGESKEEMAKPERAWELVRPWIGADDAKLVRQAVYTFQSKLAHRWREGRALLIGDSVHLMPPFMGQGMCSGLRDAANLSWKLDLVLRREATDSLLDTYVEERRPHVKTIIDMSTEVGRVSCTIDPAAAAARDAAFRAGAVPPPPPFPWMMTGLLQRNFHEHGEAVIGRLGPQGRVRTQDGCIKLCDDVVGTGWHLISLDDPRPLLDEDASRIAETLNIRFVAIGTAGGFQDVDGIYIDYFARTGLRTVLVRPDFYVFGGASNAVELNALCAQLQMSFDAFSVAEEEVVS